MDQVARWAPEDRAALFQETAVQMGPAPAIVEKDFWVCWTLSRLFAIPTRQPAMLFKGGTSLSKVYGAIQRFSEPSVTPLVRERACSTARKLRTAKKLMWPCTAQEVRSRLCQ